jgi:hypothetical protein
VREEDRERVLALRRRFYQQEKERKKRGRLREVANGKEMASAEGGERGESGRRYCW